MKFYADMHVHSRYSRATSRNCDLLELARAAARKGLRVIGTGDFTHPEWFADIREQLQPAEPGLFRLTEAMLRHLPPEEQEPAGAVRFILQVEISTIYKKDGRTRKVHHVVYAPSLEAADRFRRELDRIGNIASDGRPILGLDSRHLLELVLESDEASYLVPAHIWTPWFSVLGDKSGFNSIEECYGDLADHIFAVETGLSSDPPMNWRVSSLDRFRLVSNSDAHSPAKLGREACVFACQVDYFAMRRALQTGQGYAGTIEFFPEEGKYHFDGHRKCNICLSPQETRQYEGRCPVCGKPLTVGVMHRVEALADRPPGSRPESAAPFRSFIPLDEIIAEVEGVGSQSRRVADLREAILHRVGAELFVLAEAPLDEIARLSPMVAEGIRRMRAGEVIRYPGYDGQYGLIRLFHDEELHRRNAVALLFDLPESEERAPAPPQDAAAAAVAAVKEDTPAAPTTPTRAPGTSDPLLEGLDEYQLQAVTAEAPYLAVIAGPGTGKTHTLTRRIAYLVKRRGVPPASILAVTFTRRAAEEMRGRLSSLLTAAAGAITVTTFHGLAWRILRENARGVFRDGDFRVASVEEIISLLQQRWGLSARQAAREIARMERLRRGAATGAAEDDRINRYRALLREHGLVDYPDLILLACEVLEKPAGTPARRYAAIFVDEFQDMDRAQYRLLRRLAPIEIGETQVFVIGDPDQSIYAFRGADPHLFDRFFQDFPGAQRVVLRRNYRSTGSILEGALAFMQSRSGGSPRGLVAVGERGERIVIHRAPTERAEAEFVASTIERLLGGATFFSLDSGRATGSEEQQFSFADFAVLFRTVQQAGPVAEALARLGVPFRLLSHRPLSERPEVRWLMDFLAREGDAAGRPDSAALLAWLQEAAAAASALAPEQRRWLQEQLPQIVRRATTPEEMYRFLALGAESDLWDPRADAVSLLTLHAAKGLEFPVVFLLGCEDGILPLRFGTAEEIGHEDEERRLFFVGMTRAQRLLYLSHAARRVWRGRPRSMDPSPFLEDLKEHLVERRTAHYRRRKSASVQMSLPLDGAS